MLLQIFPFLSPLFIIKSTSFSCPLNIIITTLMRHKEVIIHPHDDPLPPHLLLINRIHHHENLPRHPLIRPHMRGGARTRREPIRMPLDPLDPQFVF